MKSEMPEHFQNRGPTRSAASNFRRYGLRAWLWSLYYRWKWRDES